MIIVSVVFKRSLFFHDKLIPGKSNFFCKRSEFKIKRQPILIQFWDESGILFKDLTFSTFKKRCL